MTECKPYCDREGANRTSQHNGITKSYRNKTGIFLFFCLGSDKQNANYNTPSSKQECSKKECNSYAVKLIYDKVKSAAPIIPAEVIRVASLILTESR